MMEKDDFYWMGQALKYAEKAAEKGEVPVGAVLVLENQFVAGEGNEPICRNDPTAHAEILAMRAGARKLQNYRLPDTVLYVTLEPCIMCMGAIIQSRIQRLVYGAKDPKTGAVESVYQIGQDGLQNHKLLITCGIFESKCSQLLTDFFKMKRKEQKRNRKKG
jgi:tRNA(adenine34) deaminase